MALVEFMTNPIDFILHVDKYIGLILQDYGILAYFILFLIIFCETGLVITPFLPGDSLIFVICFCCEGLHRYFCYFYCNGLSSNTWGYNKL